MYVIYGADEGYPFRFQLTGPLDVDVDYYSSDDE